MYRALLVLSQDGARINTYFYICSLLYPEHLVQSLEYCGTSKDIWGRKLHNRMIRQKFCQAKNICPEKNHCFVVMRIDMKYQVRK